ncbi:MAG: hypothetical protein KDD22_01295, partial [Bdellovibrionales bacterium]|nr:hypothetical protein [Bdellovibrionales bacterium]
AASLSLRECLALVLGTGPRGRGCMGLARDLLTWNQETLMTEAEFFRIYETQASEILTTLLGPAGQSRLLATLEIARRYWHFKKIGERPTGPTQQPLQQVPPSFRYGLKEELAYIPVFEKGEIGRFFVLQTGDETSVSISVRTLFRSLLSQKAQAFWLFHNRPQGSFEPSSQDRELTSQLRWISKVLGIGFWGHWILGPDFEVLLE